MSARHQVTPTRHALMVVGYRPSIAAYCALEKARALLLSCLHAFHSCSWQGECRLPHCLKARPITYMQEVSY